MKNILSRINLLVPKGIRSSSREAREFCCDRMCRRLARCFLVSKCNCDPFHSVLSRLTAFPMQALNNSETLRLLASVELACYKCKQALTDPRFAAKARRRIERIIKDDRRRRHRRRKDQEAMIDAFSKQSLGELIGAEAGPPGPSQ